MNSNTAIQDQLAVNDYLQRLNKLFRHLKYQEFEGFFDAENVMNCLEHFEVLNDYYPKPVSRIVRSMLSSFSNWREAPNQSAQSEYKIYHNRIESHTFCENAEDGKATRINAVLHIDSHNLGTPFIVNIDGDSFEVVSLADVQQITEWFKKNYGFTRNFQISAKHGENRQDVRVIRGEVVHPFRSSLEEGTDPVRSAIGVTKKEIFNYQEGKGFIVFKYEGDNPQNMYHAYHVAEDSSEVPEEIRLTLKERISNV